MTTIYIQVTKCISTNFLGNIKNRKNEKKRKKVLFRKFSPGVIKF